MLAISTGESALLDFTPEAGAAARVVTITSPPFGYKDEQGTNKNGKNADMTTRVCASNYGWFGQRVIRFVLDKREMWPVWNARLKIQSDALKDRYAAKIAENSALSRVLSHVALLAVVAEILHEDLNLPKPHGYTTTTNEETGDSLLYNPAIGKLITQCAESYRSTKVMTQQWEQFKDIINQHTHLLLYHRTDATVGSTPPTSAGWFGFWKLPENDDKHVYIYVNQAKYILTDRIGVAIADGILNTWALEGKIVPAKEAFVDGDYRSGGFTHVINVQSTSHRVIKILRSALSTIV